MPPIVAFILGALSVEIIQFGIWLIVQPGWNPGKYVRLQAGHWVVLVGAGLLFCVAWQLQALDFLVEYLPKQLTKDWGKSGVPFTPQLGIVLGSLLSFQGIDKVVAAFRARRSPAPATNGGSAS